MTQTITKTKKKVYRYKGYRKARLKFINGLLDLGKLDCYICGSKDLIVKAQEDREIPDYRKFSLDHFVPLSQGGKLTDLTNFRSCCRYCNSRKENEYSK